MLHFGDQTFGSMSFVYSSYLSDLSMILRKPVSEHRKRDVLGHDPQALGVPQPTQARSFGEGVIGWHLVRCPCWSSADTNPYISLCDVMEIPMEHGVWNLEHTHTHIYIYTYEHVININMHPNEDARSSVDLLWSVLFSSWGVTSCVHL